MFDFPNSPAPNDVIIGPGGTRYQWDGSKWFVPTPDQFLPLTGGTLNPGPLTIFNPLQSELRLNSTAGSNCIIAQRNGSDRWRINPGDESAEPGGNLGSDFTINRYADNGALLMTALNIQRSNGLITAVNGLQVGFETGPHPTFYAWGLSRFAQDVIVLGNLEVQANLVASGSVVSGATGIYSGGDLNVNSHLNVNGNAVIYGSLTMPTVGAAYLTVANNIATYTKGYQPGGGSWGDSSDARIKDIDGDYRTGLAAIEALRPVVYRFKGNDSDECGESRHRLVAAANKQFIGLVGQEVEAVMPEVAWRERGFIDGIEEDIVMTSHGPILFALINAVKELADRIEALEKH